MTYLARPIFEITSRLTKVTLRTKPAIHHITVPMDPAVRYTAAKERKRKLFVYQIV